MSHSGAPASREPVLPGEVSSAYGFSFSGSPEAILFGWSYSPTKYPKVRGAVSLSSDEWKHLHEGLIRFQESYIDATEWNVRQVRLADFGQEEGLALATSIEATYFYEEPHGNRVSTLLVCKNESFSDILRSAHQKDKPK